MLYTTTYIYYHCAPVLVGPPGNFPACLCVKTALHAQVLVARNYHHPFFNFLFSYLFSIKFRYSLIISSLFPYFNLFVSIFIQSYLTLTATYTCRPYTNVYCVMVWCVFNRVCPFYKSEKSLKGGANLYYNFQVSDVIPYCNFLFTMCYRTA